jgi:hypothetical protein
MPDPAGMTKRFARRLAGLALVLAVSGCTGASPSGIASLAPSDDASAGASTSPSAAASAIETPTSFTPISSDNLFSLLSAAQPADYVSQIRCTGPIGASDPVAIVQLVAAVDGEAGDVVLRDYADPSNPRTACTFVASIEQLIDARHVVIRGGNGVLAVVDLPEVRYHWFQVPFPGMFLAVGPKLDQVLWMLPDNDGGEDAVYLSTSAGDQVIASLPTPGRGRCGSPEFDSKVAAYTHSGSHLFVLNQPVANFNSLVVIAGETDVLSVIAPSAGWPDQGWPMMALWSRTTETLYYRRGGDVWKWTEGSDPQLFLAGTNWVNPTISADGAHLAYSVLRPDSLLHDVFLVDLAAGGSPQKIGNGARKMPAFVNSTQLYFRSEGENHGCGGAEGEQPLIYDIVDNVEFPSIFDWVMKAWPATSSNS